jgi:hypothetical protein
VNIYTPILTSLIVHYKEGMEVIYKYATFEAVTAAWMTFWFFWEKAECGQLHRYQLFGITGWVRLQDSPVKFNCSHTKFALGPNQWRILLRRIGLAKGYIMQHFTVQLELTPGQDYPLVQMNHLIVYFYRCESQLQVTKPERSINAQKSS